MFRLAVSKKIMMAREFPGAEGAGERTSGGVGQDVRSQIEGPVESS